MGNSIRALLPVLPLFLVASLSFGAPPGEVTGLGFSGKDLLQWSATGGADDYNVYRGSTFQIASVGARCHGDEVAALQFSTPGVPEPGTAFYYLVTGESDVDGEGSAGSQSAGPARETLGRCDTVMRNHVLNRSGYGWDEWGEARLATLGIDAYLSEQLDPTSIDEASNSELQARLTDIGPPDRVEDLQAIAIVRAVYARRQLEQQTALFYSNHFTTQYQEVYNFFNIYNPDLVRRRLEATTLQARDEDTFRDLAFNGNFREILEEGVVGASMILYLDNDNNVVGRPNENLSREALELHSMGVDNGYTQLDVEELAEILTGWNVCKKETGDTDDPLAPCIPRNLIGTPSEPDGAWVRNFRVDQHDCGEKTLFLGTPYETVIPTTCNGLGDPTSAGEDDLYLALDAIADHPSTAEFISSKLLKRFVTEQPTQAMIDAVVAEWNDNTHPAGRGDLREVLRAVIDQAAFLDPDQAGSKIRTPFEHVVAVFRGMRGQTNGANTVAGYMNRLQHVLYRNASPDGYSELGGDWIGTTNLLERQNFGLDLTESLFINPDFSERIIPLLNDNGISTAPGNAEAIVEFFSDKLFGGALTVMEKQAAIDYLNTDELGQTTPYNDARIRETIGFMTGYPQFLEQ